MKITGVTSFFSKNKSAYIVRIDTDEGVSGYGECSPMNVGGTCQIIHERIKPVIMGMDPLNIIKIEETIMKKNYKYSGQLLAMSFSGIELALWDIKGKYLKQPAYSLLGGKCRDIIDYYGSSMSRDLSPEAEAEKVKNAIDRFGFKAVKVKIGIRMGKSNDMPDFSRDRAKIQKIRETVGSNIKIMVDGNSSFTYFQAIQMYDMIKEYDIFVFEEPCPYYDIEAYVKLAQKLPIPINVGEQDWNLYTIRDFISRGACQISACDVTKCGGFSNAKRVADLCGAFGILYAPHNTTRGLGLMATMHLAASTPQCGFYQEFSIQAPDYRDKYVVNKPVPKNGQIKVIDCMGIGAEFDEERMCSELIVVDK